MPRGKAIEPQDSSRMVDPLDEIPSVEEVADSVTEDVAANAARLLAELQAVASNKGKRAKKLAEIEDFLGSVKVSDYPDLADSPIVQSFAQMFAKGLQPGETKHRGTLAEVSREWKLEDLKHFPPKTFTPSESLPLTWNGLTCYVVADEECTVPSPFYDVYMEHRKWMREGERHRKFLMDPKAPPPDPSLIDDATARVRAFTMLDRPPMHLSVGPILREQPVDEESAANG